MPTAPNTDPSDFSTLLDQLSAQTTEHGTMAKALEAACAEGEGEGKPKPKKGEPGYIEGEGDEGAAGGDMSKAFQVTLPDGSQAEAIDATVILKALDSDMSQVKKALPQFLGLIRQQGNMIKALADENAKLRTTGTGRRSVLNVAEKPSLTLSGNMEKAEGALSVADFMLKAEGALKAGEITGIEAAVLNTCVGSGRQPPADLASRVMAFKG
jgi:hypothetical protein